MNGKGYSFFLICCLFLAAYLVEARSSRVNVREVETLHFFNGRMTEQHRGSPVPQMECVGGNGRKHADKVRSAACKNAGWDGSQIIWKCEMELPKGLEIGKFDVVCEGWEKGDTQWIGTGTCALEYELIQTAPLGPMNAEAPPPPSHEKHTPCLEGNTCYPAGWCDPTTGVCTPPGGDTCLNGECRPRQMSVNEAKDAARKLAERQHEEYKRKREQLTEEMKERIRKANNNNEMIVGDGMFLLLLFLLLVAFGTGLVVFAILHRGHSARSVEISYCANHRRCDNPLCHYRQSVRCYDHWYDRWWYGDHYFPPRPVNVNIHTAQTSGYGSSYSGMGSGANLRPRRGQTVPSPSHPRAGEDEVDYNARRSDTSTSSGYGGTRTREESTTSSSGWFKKGASTPSPAPSPAPSSAPSEEEGSTVAVSSGFGGTRMRESTVSEPEERVSSPSQSFSTSSGWGGSSVSRRSSSSSGSSGASGGETAKTSGYGGTRMRD